MQLVMEQVMVFFTTMRLPSAQRIKFSGQIRGVSILVHLSGLGLTTWENPVAGHRQEKHVAQLPIWLASRRSRGGGFEAGGIRTFQRLIMASLCFGAKPFIQTGR